MTNPTLDIKDDTATVVVGSVMGGFMGLLAQVIGYGGIGETAAVAAAAGPSGVIAGLGSFFFCVFMGANFAKSITG
eukprot:CAMPEP_0204528830 /NCGR_PEP_ID=MMETSP0661-20131031/9739_1 /ASSEMBLY_ACC=CAM_ASM_000606 /TAXON_ID=109239 /ORGANISM="Alexandrium margalefi, Strain AMGDE01CS-322" /LENGTH=75 /DNA_ID=CAMNT_0051534827 /DNA_START=100 /DNA_END=327 /DNA_ORIENTATION=-